jgi:hypothetical protein
MPYYKLKDGEPITSRGKGGFVYIKHMCCDCGLVHRVIYKVPGNVLEYRAWRDYRATAAARRRKQAKR